MGTIRKAACAVAFLFAMGAVYVGAMFALFYFVTEPFVLAAGVPVLTAVLLGVIFLGLHILRRIWERMTVMNEDDEDYDQYGA